MWLELQMFADLLQATPSKIFRNVSTAKKPILKIAK
jgi:hypothetical protein